MRYLLRLRQARHAWWPGPIPLPWTRSRCPESRCGCGSSLPFLWACGVYRHGKRLLVMAQDTDIQSDTHG